MKRGEVEYLRRRFEEHLEHNPDAERPAINPMVWKVLIGVVVAYLMVIALWLSWPKWWPW